MKQTTVTILKTVVTRAFVEVQRGAQLPLPLGKWTPEFLPRLQEDYPRHRFSVEAGQLWYHEDPIPRAHKQIKNTVMLDRQAGQAGYQADRSEQ